MIQTFNHFTRNDLFNILNSKAGYPQPKDEVVGVSYQLSVVSTGGYFEI